MSRFVSEVCMTSLADIVLVCLASYPELFSDKCHINLLATDFFSQILAHPVFKM
jgi:hypothetical protein